jgi:hypothetical protein
MKKKTFFILMFITFLFTLINISLAIYLKFKSDKLYFITEHDSYLQYEYLIEVLIKSYIKFQNISLVFDISYYLLVKFFEKYVFNEKKEIDHDNVLLKAIKESKISNLFMEFFFLLFIKGIALGFSLFYLYEIKIETERIVNDISNPQNNNQLNILNSILSSCILMKIINLMTIIYIIFSYVYRYLKHLKHKNKNNNKYNRANSNDSGEIKMNLSQYDVELMHINQKKL